MLGHDGQLGVEGVEGHDGQLGVDGVDVGGTLRTGGNFGAISDHAGLDEDRFGFCG